MESGGIEPWGGTALPTAIPANLYNVGFKGLGSRV